MKEGPGTRIAKTITQEDKMQGRKRGFFSKIFPCVAWVLMCTLFFSPSTVLSSDLSLKKLLDRYLNPKGQDKYLEATDFRDMWWDYDAATGTLLSDSEWYARSSKTVDPLELAISRGASLGSRLVNSTGEKVLYSLTDRGQTRLNFRFDTEGDFHGAGDLLLPFYDGKYTTLYTQIGARSMEDSDDTRWIGNVGVGQRWFPLANRDFNAMGYDPGKLMLGYNLFFDYDFTRSHQRSGIGAEFWYDWLHLAMNYYIPISDWKNSEDFDDRTVDERVAEGWDARVKAYLPFYRQVALTGSYSQWYGERVSVFGKDDLEQDPHIWSYGVEYTPFPMLSGFVNQKSTEQGKTDTELGLNLTYRFGVSRQSQLRPSKVARLRTVVGSRHDFVDRENRIFLEYKTKKAYFIEHIGPNGNNVNEFIFRIKNGFDEFRAGQNVQVTSAGVILAAGPAPIAEKNFFARAGKFFGDLFSVLELYAADFTGTYTTDALGCFVVHIDSPFTGPVTLHMQSGEYAQSFTVNIVANQPWHLNRVSGASSMSQGVPGYVSLLLTRGDTPQPDVSVRFEADARISGLPADAVETDESGQITLSGITVRSPENQILIAVLDDGTRLEVPVTVIPAAYSLAVSPEKLVRHAAVDAILALKADHGTIPAGTSVSFAPNPAFVNLPAEASTDAAGEIGLPGLTAASAGAQTIEATINGSTVSVNLAVAPAACALEEAEVPALVVGLTRNARFKFLRNASPLPAGTAVSLSYSGEGAFESPPASAVLDENSLFSMDLTGEKAGEVTITAAVQGDGEETAPLTVTVQDAAHEISLEASSGAINDVRDSGTLTARVTNRGQPASGEEVAFTWAVKGTQMRQGAKTLATNSDGEAMLTIAGDGSRRTLTVTASLQKDKTKKALTDMQFGDALPSPFLVLAPDKMDWNEAGRYCASRGGRLPENLDFSAPGGRLPSGEEEYYWTRTPDANTFLLTGTDNGLSSENVGLSPDSTARVACVP